jgi:adenylate cyclase 10
MENVKLKVGIQSLLGYLPAIVIKNILDGEIDSKRLPSYYKINTVSLFADISGFTKLSESFAKKGRIGPEFLAFSLNRYMEQLSISFILFS